MAKEVKKDQEIRNQYYAIFDSLDELLDTHQHSSKSRLFLASNITGEDFDQLRSDAHLLAWIDMIENPTLYAAIRKLSTKDKVYLTLRYKYMLSQTEISEVLSISQASVSKKERGLKKYFRNFFEKGYKK